MAKTFISHAFVVKFQIFKTEFLQKHALYRAQLSGTTNSTKFQKEKFSFGVVAEHMLMDTR